MPAVLWWIRRDLRLHDNPALTTALARGDMVPVFILDPALLQGRYHREADRRRGFLFAGLAALDAALRRKGSRLVLRQGDPAVELPRLAAEAEARVVVVAADYGDYAARRDRRVGEAVELVLTTPGTAVRPPQAVLKADGTPFRVFTPYSREWLRAPPRRDDLLPAPDALPAVPRELTGVALPAFEAPEGFPAGEAEAMRRLDAFVSGADASIRRYAEDRNRMDLDGTSVLSPCLRFGMLSPRLAAVTALEVQARARGAAAQKGAATWLNELVWRDFYLAALHHFPDVLRLEFDTAFRGLAWRDHGADAAADLEAWKAGRTGYPVIDAAMRQLAQTGWMHNRARMLVASFLVKHLLVDWRIGEVWFMQQLVDGDPAANNGGWQWAAGVGTDAAPYFRVFNPVLQGKRFDPDGAFVRRWLPELAAVPDRYIHEPWRMPARVREEAGFSLGEDYPEPIIELDAGRQRALEAYRSAKRS